MSDGSLPQPGLDMGRVIRKTLDILDSNYASIGAVAFAVALVNAVAEAAFSEVVTTPSVMAFGLAILVVAIGVVTNGIAVGGITRIAIGDLDGRRIGTGAALASGVKLILPLAGLSFVAGIGICLLSFLFLVPGIWLTLRWLVSAPALVTEQATIGNALSRSAALTEGSRWQLLGLVMIWVAMSVAISFGIGFPLSLAGVVKGSPLMGVVEVIVSTLRTAIGATGVAVCYMELRRGVEGGVFPIGRGRSDVG